MSPGRGRTDGAAPLDLRAAMERLEGDRALLEEVLDLFIREYPRMKAEIEGALRARDAEALRRAAHSLKGAAANVNLTPLSGTAFRLETAAGDGRLDEAGALVETLQSEFDRFEEFRAAGFGPPRATAKKAGMGGSRRRGKKKILIVDDDGGTRVLAAAWARGAGWEADAAGDGREALRRIAARAYDLIIVDLHLPDASGFEISSRIRRLERKLGRPPARLAAWTASLDPASEARGLASGFSLCLEKPAGKSAVLGILDPAAAAPGVRSSLDETVRDLVPEYLKNRADDLLAMTEARARGNFHLLESSAHRIKGSAASFGFPDLGEICADLEAAARARNVQDTGRALARFKSFLAGLEMRRE